MNILANDGISESGKNKLEEYGFNVDLTTVAQDQLVNYINENSISTLLVRSATQVRKDIIDNCPSLKIIGRGGVGMDNIDVEYAKSKNINVINTPAASSKSVAELVFSHLFGCVRFLHESNRSMPLDGDSKFKELKKSYAGGRELAGKKIGIIGFGRIGQEVAKIAIGIGMEVVFHDKYIDKTVLEIEFFDGQNISFNMTSSAFEEVLENSDFISVHIPASDKYIIDSKEIAKMKDGVGLLNLSRGGIINEEDFCNPVRSAAFEPQILSIFDEDVFCRNILRVNKDLESINADDEHESKESSQPVLLPFDMSNEIVHVSSIVADIKLEQFVDWKVMPGITGAFGDWLELLTQLV